MSFYRVDIVSSMGSNEYINTLYYEHEGAIIGAWYGADELAERVKAEVAPAFKGASSWAVRVEKIRVTPFDDNFSLKLFQPYELACGWAGEVTGVGDPLPVEQVLNIRLNLSPTDRFTFAEQPRRGRIYLSGLHEHYFAQGLLIENLGDELIPGSMRARLRNLCNKVALPLMDSILPDWADSGGFEPVRAKWSKMLGGLVKIVGYARIQSASYATRISYLRPRQKN